MKRVFDFAFLTYFEKDASFFGDLAQHLTKTSGKKSILLSYSLSTDAYLRQRGIEFFSMDAARAKVDMTEWESSIAGLERKYQLTSLRLLCGHERISLNTQNETILLQRAYRLFRVYERFFQEYEAEAAIHEIGGWLGNRILDIVAQASGCANVYIEPAMFRGNVIFFKNSSMPIIKRLYRYEELSSEQEAKAREIIDASVKTKTVIMPFKDISKYRDVGLGFAFNFKNVKNMFRGLHRRYVINKGEELVEPLWSIALRWYILRAVRRKFLKPYYSMPVQGEKYFYYPLHMPIDMQILVRSPQFFDQYYLIEYIARSLPHGVKLYVKEHPVSIGMYDYFAMRKVAKIPNVLLINPNVNSHPIIQNAQAVITVNSKVGYEALYHGKPVITVGDSFYRKRGLTIDVENLAEIGQAIKQCQSFKVDEQKLTAFVYSVYANAFPGELYQNKDENYRAFGDSLLRFLDENRI